MKYSENFSVVSQNLGYSTAPKSIRPCAGGCIHDSNVWEFPDGQRYFVKFSGDASGQAMLEAEHHALALLAQTETVRCPQPILATPIPDEGFVLVMEYLELGSLRAPSGARLGEKLAQLHECHADRFGLERDNFLGRNPQPNNLASDWSEFFWHHRIRYQLEQALQRGYALPNPSRAESCIRQALAGHHPAPSLLHGDLWGGNAGSLPDETPVVFDPASYFGDREADLAFTEMFGGFPPSFYQAYEKAAPLDPGYTERKQLYNLYHYLNHLNHFGSTYLGSCQETFRSLERRFA